MGARATFEGGPQGPERDSYFEQSSFLKALTFVTICESDFIVNHNSSRAVGKKGMDKDHKGVA